MSPDIKNQLLAAARNKRLRKRWRRWKEANPERRHSLKEIARVQGWFKWDARTKYSEQEFRRRYETIYMRPLSKEAVAVEAKIAGIDCGDFFSDDPIPDVTKYYNHSADAIDYMALETRILATRPVDSYIHPEFTLNLAGVKTGRMSSSEPNKQDIPPHTPNAAERL